MTSPALLHLSLDTPGISGASTTAAGAVILAAPGITSRLNHAGQGEPARREPGYATMQLAGPNVFGFPLTGRASPLPGEESQ
jgi:hypothetical protein